MVDKVIENHPRGGRCSLKRELAAICRWVAKQVASEQADDLSPSTRISSRDPWSHPLLEGHRRAPRYLAWRRASWTAVGGEILFIEATDA